MIILFFILWLILNGRVTLEIVLFGLLFAGAVAIFVHRVFGYGPDSDLQILRNLPWFILYILVLIREIIRSAAAVGIFALSPSKKPDPEIIEFHSGLESEFLNVLLANSITLTPGTYTLFQEGDYFMIHCLRKEYADGFGDSSFLPILKKIRFFRKGDENES